MAVLLDTEHPQLLSELNVIYVIQAWNVEDEWGVELCCRGSIVV